MYITLKEKLLLLLQTRQLLLIVEDELRSLQPNFDETLCDKVLMSFKDDLKSIALSMCICMH